MQRLRITLAVGAVATAAVALRQRHAARTANDYRAPQARPPERPDPAALRRDELYRRAQALDIPGRSRMRKAELADAVAHASASPAT